VRYIGIDIGTSCGYAWTDDGKVHSNLSGVADFTPRRHEGGGMRYLRFRRMLATLVDDPLSTVVFYEEVAAHKGTTAAHVYGGFLAVLSEWCEERSIPYRGLPVGSIKKHATGLGNASKAKMLASAFSTFGPVQSEDAADALWTLSLGLKELNDDL
tara:strand:+ start:2544 stop:3011 length:468 start_codon:yes stop_codon:yes gene_type:complete